MLQRSRGRRLLGISTISLLLSVSGIVLTESPSRAGTSSALDQVQAELRASLRLTSLPTVLHPATNKWTNLWQSDFGPVSTGGGDSTCWDQSKSSTSLSKCVYGDPLAKRTLVVTGDSQAWMWEPAFDKWGVADKWKVIVLSKGSCPPWPDAQQEYLNNEAFPACATFQSNVVKYINSTRPSVVVAAGLSPAVQSPSVSRVQSDVKTFVTSIAPSKAKVLIVNPSPSYYSYDYSAHSTLSAPTCVVSHANQLRVCDIAKKLLLDYFMNLAVNEGHLPGGSKVLNLTQLLCTKECPMIADGTLVYVDSDHVTYGWAVHVSGALGEILAPDLKGL